MFRKIIVLEILFCSALAAVPAIASSETDHGIKPAPDQEVLELEEYLEKGGMEWFLTGKKNYPVQAMMVSKEFSFCNELENTDYTAVDDGVTVVLKGTSGELWTTKISKVISTYTKPDGSAVSLPDFAVKDVFIDLITIPRADSNFAMFVPNKVSVTVVTGSGNVLHTNLPNAPHGEGDYLVCRIAEDGTPDTSDVWVLNGLLFPETYENAERGTSNAAKDRDQD